MKNIYISLNCLLAMAILTGCNNSVRETDLKPNIIVILIDDAGYTDFGYMGSEDLETPRIDELAARSTIFMDAHVTATVCAPSRAGLITGRYQQRFGHECNGTGGNLGTDPSEITIANAMRSHGYKTVAIGKWHLGHTEDYIPTNRGFDEFFGFLGGSRSYFPQEDPNILHKIMHNTEPVEFSGYLTDVFGEKAVEYIETFKGEPFFMYLSFNAVHTPMEARQVHLDKFKAHPRQKLAAMTWSLDENIGKIIDKIEDENLLENTIIWFLSDNGGANNNQSDNGYLKGWKGNKFEGGHRVPFMVSWPGTIPEGNSFDGLTSSLDIFTTSVAAAGKEDHEENSLDGVDLLPFLLGQKEGNPHTSLFWRKDEAAAVRENDLKLIRLDNFGCRIYDLASDSIESVDLSENDPETLEKLIGELEEWETGMIEPLWIEEEEWNEVTREIHLSLMQNREPKYIVPSQYFKYLEQAANNDSIENN